MKANDVRQKFLDYFSRRGHRRVASSSLVPQDDPTLLFANAGMNQFKRLFTGEEKRDYNRATTSQKCVRAGGKHNDLENVGYTARHHTFFEMLGNFSFGDYFKEEAIEFGWELLTKEYGLPADRLYATIYQDDDQAYDLWRKVAGLPAGRICRLGEKDNFWAMGDTGPCGPCSEILIDQGPHIGCGRPDCAPGCDCDRYLELWNLVFMQFERNADGRLKPLPKPSIDTGMGLERLSAVCQGVYSNFETDLFTPLLEKAAALTGIPYIYGQELKPGDQGFGANVSTRVLADHARAVTFLIGDGVRPENLGRGYVLRRILRRAVRHGRKLGLERPFLAQLTEVIIEHMKGAYPDLADNGAYIRQIITGEEERFGETLGAGLNMLNGAIADLEKKKSRVIDGRLAFKLYDTYGFPLDLVGDVAREHGLSVDEERFNEAMAEQKAKSRASWKGAAGGDDDRLRPLVNELTARGFGTAFLGYESLTEDGAPLALMIKNGRKAEEAVQGDELILVFAATPFYAFSGGQTGDVGEIHFPAGLVEVYDVRKAPGANVFLHQGVLAEGRLAAGEKGRLAVDEAHRLATARNHSATHLLHKALRTVLGEHVRQAGSLVSAERLRFDFTNPTAVGREDIEKLEKMVNEAIRRDWPVSTEVMNLEEAARSGAVALFEERYGETVRVVSMGDYSRELCGGTHVGRTGQIGAFLIVGEGSVAAGVRRFECLTGEGAVEQIQKERRLVAELGGLLKTRPEELPERLARLQARVRELEKSGGRLDGSELAALMSSVVEKDGVRLLAARVEAADPRALRTLGDELKARLGPQGLIGLAAAGADGKAMLLVVVGSGLTGRFKAGQIVADLAAEVGGQGGGRDDLAQAGGPSAEGLPAALELFKRLI
ncbi:MAG: alanine--tRNA ligase [Candidatus Adiutrix sp.]|jgi:alanyl-tRNA synthetase|nr:alanine--tRNA ligase [Candidatus Adiutrix sp.]